jgi:hypothetical protein
MICYFIEWLCELCFDVLVVECMHVYELWAHMCTMCVPVCIVISVFGYLWNRCIVFNWKNKNKNRKQAINRKTRVFAVCIRKIHMTNRLCRVHFPNTHGNGLAEYPSRTRQSVCHVYTETKCIIILFSLNSSQVAANILPTSNIRTCKLGSLAPKGSTHDTNP